MISQAAAYARDMKRMKRLKSEFNRTDTHKGDKQLRKYYIRSSI